MSANSTPSDQQTRDNYGFLYGLMGIDGGDVRSGFAQMRDRMGQADINPGLLGLMDEALGPGMDFFAAIQELFAPLFEAARGAGLIPANAQNPETGATSSAPVPDPLISPEELAEIEKIPADANIMYGTAVELPTSFFKEGHMDAYAMDENGHLEDLNRRVNPEYIAEAQYFHVEGDRGGYLATMKTGEQVYLGGGAVDAAQLDEETRIIMERPEPVAVTPAPEPAPSVAAAAPTVTASGPTTPAPQV